MDNQISNVCKKCYFYIAWINKIGRFLDFDVTKSLVHALVISRLDYCNSLYIGLPKYSLYRLQKVMNTAARVIFKVGRREHISPYLQRLHWLPVEVRIQFKILTVTFNSVHNTGPAYLNDLVSF